MINVEAVYWLVGILFVAWASLIAADTNHPRRWGSSAFWGLLGLCFFYSTWVQAGTAPAWILGVAVLVLVVLASTGLLGHGKHRTSTGPEREAYAKRFGNKLFIPALTLPLVTVILVLAAPVLVIGGTPLLDPKNTTLVALAIGAVAAVVVALVILKPKNPATPLFESRRILESIGWAALLPQMLTTLGILFTKAGVGTAVGTLASGLLPKGSLIAGVLVYCIGMFLFTVLMGNGFAAFPIMTAAIGWPVLVQTFHGDPAIIFAIGMLAGFCGTLCTPMAANFNLVPSALLEMKNKYGVITAQVGTAIPLLAVNIALMYFLAFH
ncbi:DUF979 domain-containing protein [Pseudarthrobacter sp. NIBRBAC000502770]|uniref:DUF979 domain-containing protein n=1 Tax=Pseudarthrobacter sp. NIBRBAC000502770 TaxID=2590785 RepID=UPI00113FD3A4|nr:DUF979 domain-containing protein [Pseudarthrobacter sp. NIBRBAC000502770]QDG87452.1 DUF979 domain-containing protein [Pseudarthrobacter sp. NIBRBAC000502770]